MNEESKEKNKKVLKISLNKLILIIVMLIVIVALITGIVIYVKNNSLNESNNDILSEVNVISKENMKEITKNDEEKIIELVEMTKEEFEEYKQNFITLSKDTKLLFNTKSKEEIEKIAQDNFNALENYILMNDENITEFLKNTINSSNVKKYKSNLLICYASSGIISSYLNLDNYELELTKISGPYANNNMEIFFTINNKNLAVISYSEDECWVYIYKGTQYNDNKKALYEIRINSADYLQYWDSIENMPVDAKPVIYLYPEETTKVSVKLGRSEKITCSYPKYEENGWNVMAEPSGKLTDIKTGRELYCLYWEGKNTAKTNMEEGFVVKGEDTIEFLEEKLEILGLNEKESEEFIIYWLPQMEKNKYNYIRFETEEEINKNMPLEITPVPDTVIRINMEWKALEEAIKVKEQVLEEAPERNGFTVVEWGGTILN